jgi:hypothetical protein
VASNEGCLILFFMGLLTPILIYLFLGCDLADELFYLRYSQRVYLVFVYFGLALETFSGCKDISFRKTANRVMPG